MSHHRLLGGEVYWCFPFALQPTGRRLQGIQSHSSADVTLPRSPQAEPCSAHTPRAPPPSVHRTAASPTPRQPIRILLPRRGHRRTCSPISPHQPARNGGTFLHHSSQDPSPPGSQASRLSPSFPHTSGLSAHCLSSISTPRCQGPRDSTLCRKRSQCPALGSQASSLPPQPHPCLCHHE